MTVEHVRVGEVLSLQRRAVDVEVEGVYEEVGVRSFGRGIFHKGPVSGFELGTKRVFRIEPGDLVLSNVFAWEGAIARASEAETGKIGSHRFMTFVPTDERVDTSWAAWFFLSEGGLELIRKASPGSAGRNRTLAIERFEVLEIPLPPIDEQRRIADRLDRLRAAAVELRRRSDHSSKLASGLAVSMAARSDLDAEAKAQAGWRRVELGSIMTPADDRITVEPDGSYPNVGIYSFGRGLFAKPDIEGSKTTAKTLNSLRAGQFVYSRLFAFEGAYSYVSPGFDGFFVSNEFPAFDTDPDQLDARWLANYLRSPERWAELRGSSKGLGVRRQRVPVEAVMDYEVWLPPIEYQQTVVAMVERIDLIRNGRADSERRIASLVPAMLNETFAWLR